MKNVTNAMGVAAVAAVSFAPMQQAQASEGNPWAECGIGAMVFDDNATAAAISNIIWDLGTTAVSSDASSAENCEGRKMNKAAAAFILDTHVALEEDMAKGQGQKLAALVDLIDVAADQKSAVSQAIHQEYKKQMLNSQIAGLEGDMKAEALYQIAMKAKAAV